MGYLKEDLTQMSDSIIHMTAIHIADAANHLRQTEVRDRLLIIIVTLIDELETRNPSDGAELQGIIENILNHDLN